MGWRPKVSSLHHHRPDLRYLDGFAATVLLRGRRTVELGPKASKGLK